MTMDRMPTQYKIYQAPKIAGSYFIGNYRSAFHITLTIKPNLFHRFMMKLCLGFKWIDHK